MKVPAIFLGTGASVRRRLRAHLKEDPSQADWGDLVDTSDYPDALLLVDQVARNLPGQNFHLYALFEEILDRKDRGLGERWFDWALSQPWSLAGLMSSGGKRFFAGADLGVDETRAARRRPYLSAFRKLFDELEEEGPRFQVLALTDTMSRLGVAKYYSILKQAGVHVSEPGPAALRAALDTYLDSSGAPC